MPELRVSQPAHRARTGVSCKEMVDRRNRFDRTRASYLLTELVLLIHSITTAIR